jgi:hypothetical protein
MPLFKSCLYPVTANLLGIITLFYVHLVEKQAITPNKMILSQVSDGILDTVHT